MAQKQVNVRHRKPFFQKQQKTDCLLKEKEKDFESQKELERLTVLTSDLKLLLKEEKDRNNELMQAYADLQLKHQIIEKEFLNLKYETGKKAIQDESKLRKAISQRVRLYLTQTIEQFQANQQNQSTSTQPQTSAKDAISKLFESIMRVPTMIIDSKRNSYYLHSLECAIHPNKLIGSPLQHIQLSPEERKQKVIEDEIPEPIPDQKCQDQPSLTQESTQIQDLAQAIPEPDEIKKEMDLKQSESQINPIGDEYYGDLQEYQHLDQKIQLRKNYELLKNVKNATDGKRKKIFTQEIFKQEST